MSKSSDDWYCSACLASIFPFYHFDNDIDFFFALYDFNFQGDFDTELLKQKKFNPFLITWDISFINELQPWSQR